MSGRPLRILCFGDSLTSGFCHFGLTEHPYSIRLKNRLEAAFPDRRIDVYTNGQPGDVVSNEPWEFRLDAELKKRNYDWVIVLGGTNDIGTARSAETTLKALDMSWQRILIRKSKLLALTIPECHANVQWLDAARDKINAEILSRKMPNFHSFDLKKHIPYHSLSDTERDEYWDDGLHLSPIGYDWMGDHVADALIPLLKADGAGSAPPKRDSESFFREPDNDLVFEEEVGSSRHISQGYIVVRKKDLD